MDLDGTVYEQIVALSKTGDSYYDRDQYDKAVFSYLDALALVPDPKQDWEAGTWLYSALGDALFMQQRYEDSLAAFRSAEKCPDGMDNAFVVLMIGECSYELHDRKQAREYLLKAYMLEGEAIFETQDQKYYRTISDLV